VGAGVPRGRGFADNYTTFRRPSASRSRFSKVSVSARRSSNLRIAKANRGISDWQHRQNRDRRRHERHLRLQQSPAGAGQSPHREAVPAKSATQLFVENQKEAHGRLPPPTPKSYRRTAPGPPAAKEKPSWSPRRACTTWRNQLRLLNRCETAFRALGPDPRNCRAPPGRGTSRSTRPPDVKKSLRPPSRLPDGAPRPLPSIGCANNTAGAKPPCCLGSISSAATATAARGRDFRTARDQGCATRTPRFLLRRPWWFVSRSRFGGGAAARARAAAKLNLHQGEADLVRLEQDIALSVTAAAGQIETTRPARRGGQNSPMNSPTRRSEKREEALQGRHQHDVSSCCSNSKSSPPRRAAMPRLSPTQRRAPLRPYQRGELGHDGSRPTRSR